jgi:hypothetical protein
MVGVLFWISMVCLVWSIESNVSPNEPRRALRGLVQYWTGQRPIARLRLPEPVDIAIGDPVFVSEGAELRQVGGVRALVQDDAVIAARRAKAAGAEIQLFPTAPTCGPNAELTYFTAPDSLAWVVETLLTPDRKALISQEIRAAYGEYRTELLASFRPMVEGTLREGLVVIEQDLPSAIERHRAQIQALGSKYEREIVNRELLPLAQREIWPIVQRRAEPVVDRIGIELWERVSLWRFAWRAAYDRSPLPDRQLLEQEWRRFVRNEAMPIVSQHTSEMIEVVRDVIRDASRNDAVQAGVRDSLAHVASDPEFQQLVWQVFEEVIAANPRLRDVIEQQWTGPEAQQAFELASDRLEPAVRRIGDLVFGSFEHGITPEFAQVLRTQILAKDQRWFLLDPKPDGIGAARRGTAVFAVRLAAERSAPGGPSARLKGGL